jgi:hypothetical protein
MPRLPVRQWALSVPKRLRYFLQRDANLPGAALRLFLRAVESCLRATRDGLVPAPANPPAHGHAGGNAHPKVPRPACAAAPCHRQSTNANRRLTRATDATTIRLAQLNCLSFATTTDITTTDITQCRPVRTATGIAMSHCDMRIRMYRMHTATEAARYPGST